jgi:hypothetical protein
MWNILAQWEKVIRSGFRMVKNKMADHLKTEHKYVWFSYISGIWMSSTVTIWKQEQSSFGMFDFCSVLQWF